MKLTTPTLVVASSLLVASSLAAPTADKPSNALHHVPIQKRNHVKRSGDELLAWANEQKAMLQSKYKLGSASNTKRAASGTSLINVQYDSSWSATLYGGTPSQAYEIVLDTGSADLWIDSQYYNPTSSSSFTNRSTPFSIQYGSGQVEGYEGTDTFTLAGTTVNNLYVAVADQVTSGLAASNMQGIMGMGFQRLSSSGDPPFWVAANVDTFSFYLERASLTSANQVQAGGTFTLGGTNSSLYQGSINYNPLIEELYWMVRLGGAGAKGSSVNLNGLTRAAIDTGTTLIGGPDSVVAEIYANIPGSSSQGNGYYSYPCSSTIDATLTFGGIQYTIPDRDFYAGSLDRTGSQCLGAFFGLGSGAQTDLQWIVGDSFLKNVYSVFTTGSNGPAVGFASLASGLNSGTNSRQVSSSSSGSSTGSSSPAAKNSLISLKRVAVAAALPLLAMLFA